MGSRARAVTPLLAVGEFGSSVREHVTAFEAETAARLVQEGVNVLVPDDSMARDTLHELGMSEELIEERIQFSHTGIVGTAV